MQIDYSKWAPNSTVLLALMTVETDFVNYDFEANALVFDNGVIIPGAALGLGVGAEPDEILSL